MWQKKLRLINYFRCSTYNTQPTTTKWNCWRNNAAFTHLTETHQEAEELDDALVGDSDDEGRSGVGEVPVRRDRSSLDTVGAAESWLRWLHGAHAAVLLQHCSGLGAGDVSLHHLHVAICRHLVLEQQRLSPLFRNSSPPAGSSAACSVEYLMNI